MYVCVFIFIFILSFPLSEFPLFFRFSTPSLRAQKGEIAGVGPKSIEMMKEFLETGKMGKLVGADWNLLELFLRVYKRPFACPTKNISASCVDIPFRYDSTWTVDARSLHKNMPPETP